MIGRWLVLPAMLAFITAVSANEASPETVTVTATRLEKLLHEVPAAVDVVSREQVQLARQQLGLDESLARMPGLFMQNRYNFAQDLRVSIRGFGARANFGIRGVRIFVDGIPETLPDGQGQVDSIDLGSVERITVLRGAASSLYGNAAGGVILIDSERAPQQPMVEARSSYGAYGFRKHQLKTAGTAGKLGYMLNLSDLALEGYRAQSRMEGRQANGVIRYDFDPSANLTLALNHTDQPVSEDAGALTRIEASTRPRSAAPASVIFDGGENLKQTRVGLAFEKSLGEAHTFGARNYYVWREFENLLAFRNGGAVTIDRFFAGGGVSYTYSSTLAGRGNRLVVGLDADRQEDDRRRFNNDFGVLGTLTFDQRERVAGTGFFLHNELQLRDDLELTLGARHDRVTIDVGDRFVGDGNDSGARTLEETSPMAALLYRLSPGLNVYANISTSFETPTTTELANPAGGGGFNTALDPQIATNYELGLKGVLNDSGRFDLALFRIDVSDELIPFEIAGSPGRSFYRNAGKSRRQGVEASIAVTPLAGLDLSLAYTGSDFVFREFIDNTGMSFGGNRIPGLPKHLVHGEAVWRHPAGWFVAADALYAGALYADNANRVESSAFTVANTRAGFEMGAGAWSGSVFAGVNNLLDERYNGNIRINAAAGRYFEPAPGANAYAGATLRYRFGE